ncbi:sperm flagellar protein 1-like isoform X2 [Poeciliopsis prolifica]|uniref:sperm flagellar protein 1-like isoform X2 n=1 Tax=Poeciliopsis prolifica TaxID=188132 RepID=UPI00241454AA|nr:sperm flagellar protein 1-like isoform X2 [Poeciliopsis prolifica]
MCIVLVMESLLSEEEERDTLAWVDKLPLSRHTKHINRDFSDGVMVAEIVKHYFPKIVDIHNYITSCKRQQKISNWNLLNKRVFSKLEFYVSDEAVEKIVSSIPGAILPVMFFLKEKLEKKLSFSDVEIQEAEAKLVAELAEMKIAEPTVNPQQVTFFTDMSLSVTRQIILEKELQVQELQDILKNLQVKVSKLEELIQLKDKRIEHLTCLSGMYKTKLRLASP